MRVASGSRSAQERKIHPRRTPASLQTILARRVSGKFGLLYFIALKLLSVEFPRSVVFGDGLQLAHGAAGLVVHENSRLGEDVTLYQGVTLGRADQYKQGEGLNRGGGVVIGDRTSICPGAVVLYRSGRVRSIGSDVIVGANSVVLSDIPDGEIWAGVPARRIGLNPARPAHKCP